MTRAVCRAQLCDWEAMRRADVLATNQSTFSFTAAMFAVAPDPEITAEITAERADAAGAPPRCAPARRFWRPEPAAGAIVPFDPWNASVLLNACGSGTTFRRDHAQRAPEGDAKWSTLRRR